MKVNQFTNANQIQLKKAENVTSQTPALKLNTLQQDTVSFSGGKSEVAKQIIKKKDPTRLMDIPSSWEQFAEIAGIHESKLFEGFDSHLKFRNPVHQAAKS